MMLDPQQVREQKKRAKALDKSHANRATLCALLAQREAQLKDCRSRLVELEAKQPICSQARLNKAMNRVAELSSVADEAAEASVVGCIVDGVEYREEVSDE
jgi:hypothetical protein